jgi:hypothetical protein
MRTLSNLEISSIAGGTFCRPHPVCTPAIKLDVLAALLSCIKLSVSIDVSVGTCTPKPKPPVKTCGGTSTPVDEPYLG